jgi:RHS repeat-associated protein
MKRLKRASGLGLALALAFLSPGLVSGADVVQFYHLDAIGNVRAVTNATGAVVERHDYLPFGEECTTGVCASNPGITASQPRHFTSKERDTETGLDYFGGRYYRSNIGRFTTVDPAYVLQQNLVDPQRWNKYSYVRNNPLKYTDPDGRLIDIIADAGFIAYDVIDIGVTRFTGGEVSGTQRAALAADVAAAAIPFVTGAGIAIRAAARAEHAAEAARAGEALIQVNRARGLESEARTLSALGEVKNTEKVVGREGASVPDYMNRTTVGEIKDARRVTDSRQLRIQREAAAASGREHVVEAGTKARVSKAVQEQSTVRRRDDLGPR